MSAKPDECRRVLTSVGAHTYTHAQHVTLGTTSVRTDLISEYNLLIVVMQYLFARLEEGRSAFKVLTGKPTGKRHLGRPRRRWEDNIRMDFEEIGINAGNLVDLAQYRNYWRALVNAALNLRVT